MTTAVLLKVWPDPLTEENTNNQFLATRHALKTTELISPLAAPYDSRMPRSGKYWARIIDPE